MVKKIHPEIDEELFIWAETISASLGMSMSRYINYVIERDIERLTPDERKFLQDFRKKMLSSQQPTEKAETKPVRSKRAA